MLPKCACGCGKNVTKIKNKYLKGHQQRTEENRKKRSKIASRINKGRILSEKSKNKISNSLIGYKHTEEAKEKMSNTKMGKFTKENNNNWKGKYTSKYGSGWTDRLKLKIKKRDDFKCQYIECTKQSKRLEVHHIDRDKNNNMLENLITLCSICHKKVHNEALIDSANKIFKVSQKDNVSIVKEF